MKSEYLQAYQTLHERHWWWRARQTIVLKELDRMRPDRRWGRILDVGCGDGLFFPRLSERGDVVGLEPEGEIVTVRERADGRIHVREFDTTFRPSGSFGLVMMLDLLEHLSEPVEALAHAGTLLDRDGRILITVPAFKILWTAHDELNHHRCRYSRNSLEREVRAAGLDVIECSFVFHWLFPVKLILRVREAFFGQRADIPPIPPSPLNNVLERFSVLEHRVLRDVPVPFGSSLLMIAGSRNG